MKRNWMTTMVVAGALNSVMFGQQYPQQSGQQYPQQYPQQSRQQYPQQYPQQSEQQYPQQDPNYQGDPNDNGQYQGDPNDNSYRGPDCDNNDQGVYAPSPPPMPNYAYGRSQMPGPGYSWVDGYWNFGAGRYAWVNGYWMMPPYAGGFWVAPRYSSGRFFVGYWGGSRPAYYNRGYVNRGYVQNAYRNQGRSPAFRQSYQAPMQHGNSFQDGGRQSFNQGYSRNDRQSFVRNQNSRSNDRGPNNNRRW